jgi:hypothetical protein
LGRRSPGTAFGLALSPATSAWTAVDLPMAIDPSIVPYGATVAAEDGFVVKALVPTQDAHGVVSSHENHLWFWKPPEQ